MTDLGDGLDGLLGHLKQDAPKPGIADAGHVSGAPVLSRFGQPQVVACQVFDLLEVIKPGRAASLSDELSRQVVVDVGDGPDDGEGRVLPGQVHQRLLDSLQLVLDGLEFGDPGIQGDPQALFPILCRHPGGPFGPGLKVQESLPTVMRSAPG